MQSEIARLLAAREPHRPQLERIRERCAGKCLYIYGAGFTGKKLCDALLQEGIFPKAMIDRDAGPGARYRNIPLLPPDALAQNGDALVVVCHSTESAEREMAAYCRTRGISQIYTISDFFLADYACMRQASSKLRELFELLNDEESRVTLLALVRASLYLDASALLPPCPYGVGLVPEIPALPGPGRMIDCGAYTGDSVERMLSAGRQLESVLCLEPDPQNYRTLLAYLRGSGIGKTFALLSAVSNTEQILPFSLTGGANSAAGAEGDSLVQCFSIDTLSAKFPPTIIKMDIEGGEKNALLGAQRTIKKYAPDLMISVYHKTEDLWTLPLLIHSLVPAYRMYLRTHGRYGIDTVFYATAGNTPR